MRGFVASLLVAAVVLATAVPSRAVTPVFLLDTDEATFTLIHRVNPQTGQLTTIGSLPAQETIVALAAANDNLLYAAAWSGALYRITVAPFAYTIVGNVGVNEFVGLAYGDGMLFATDQVTGVLARINPATAARTNVGTIRLANNRPLVITGGDIVQAANGTWLLWTNELLTLYTLNVATAVATPTSQPFNQWYSGLAVDYQNGGRLYGSATFEDELVTTNQGNGARISAVPFCLNCPIPYDLAFGDMASPRCTDGDRDGYFAEGGTCGQRDCNDADAAVNPRARDLCNGRDDDCDGAIDDGASAYCSDNNACTLSDRCTAGVCVAGTPRSCSTYSTWLRSPVCRPSDGACCGRLNILPTLNVCLP